MIEEEEVISASNVLKPLPLPENFLETDPVDRLECSVRNFLLRSACKVDCFYTVKEEMKHTKEGADEWLDSEDEEDELPYEERFVEKHFVALPSIIFSNSENPHHKLHITCLVSPRLEDHEKERLKFQEDVLISVEK